MCNLTNIFNDTVNFIKPILSLIFLKIITKNALIVIRDEKWITWNRSEKFAIEWRAKKKIHTCYAWTFALRYTLSRDNSLFLFNRKRDKRPFKMERLVQSRELKRLVLIGLFAKDIQANTRSRVESGTRRRGGT